MLGTARTRRLPLVLVVVLVLVASGCDLRVLVPPGDAPLRYRDLVFPSATKTANVVYGHAVDQLGTNVTLTLDLYQPDGDTVTARPVFVFIHGGSFRGGTKTDANMVDLATTFARKGYVTASINYRLHPTGCSPGGSAASCVTAIEQAKNDAQTAVRWLRANAPTYGLDSTRIAVGGSSAGAITALNVGLDPNDPGDGEHQGWSSSVLFAMGISGSGFYPADPGDATLLDFHGTADPTVPYQWAQNTFADADAKGLTAYLTTWDGAGHVPYAAHRTQIIDETTNLSYWALALYSAPS